MGLQGFITDQNNKLLLEGKMEDELSAQIYKELKRNKDLFRNLTSSTRLVFKEKNLAETLASTILDVDPTQRKSWRFKIKEWILSGELNILEDAQLLKQDLDYHMKSHSQTRDFEKRSDLAEFVLNIKRNRGMVDDIFKYTFDVDYYDKRFHIYKIQAKDKEEYKEKMRNCTTWCLAQGYFDHYGLPHFILVDKKEKKQYAIVPGGGQFRDSAQNRENSQKRFEEFDRILKLRERYYSELPTDVSLIDRYIYNHHSFKPILYQKFREKLNLVDYDNRFNIYEVTPGDIQFYRMVVNVISGVGSDKIQYPHFLLIDKDKKEEFVIQSQTKEFKIFTTFKHDDRKLEEYDKLLNIKVKYFYDDVWEAVFNKIEGINLDIDEVWILEYEKNLFADLHLDYRDVDESNLYIIDAQFPIGKNFDTVTEVPIKVSIYEEDKVGDIEGLIHHDLEEKIKFNKAETIEATIENAAKNISEYLGKNVERWKEIINEQGRLAHAWISIFNNIGKDDDWYVIAEPHMEHAEATFFHRGIDAFLEFDISKSFIGTDDLKFYAYFRDDDGNTLDIDSGKLKEGTINIKAPRGTDSITHAEEKIYDFLSNVKDDMKEAIDNFFDKELQSLDVDYKNDTFTIFNVTLKDRKIIEDKMGKLEDYIFNGQLFLIVDSSNAQAYILSPRYGSFFTKEQSAVFEDLDKKLDLRGKYYAKETPRMVKDDFIYTEQLLSKFKKDDSDFIRILMDTEWGREYADDDSDSNFDWEANREWEDYLPNYVWQEIYKIPLEDREQYFKNNPDKLPRAETLMDPLFLWEHGYNVHNKKDMEKLQQRIEDHLIRGEEW
jgi:hypothetical protein